MSVKSPEHVFLGAQIPANYSAALAARALREDRSKSSVVRLALAAFLFGPEIEERTAVITEAERARARDA